MTRWTHCAFYGPIMATAKIKSNRFRSICHNELTVVCYLLYCNLIVGQWTVDTGKKVFLKILLRQQPIIKNNRCQIVMLN